ncbi:hypothetical protein [Actinoplanes teichomyceticus]|uniref:Secreted protein n=1 Tax=Actinoplanes teichomyceticus TaxID=1867 RepID=A0A561WBW4_ACTTI|nr:hypothetical protein [Actinoplanes teichomyceticus]TWG21356.1 hypothetical protein FHX34_103894 [Actinoplanes teichomyceticus]
MTWRKMAGSGSAAALLASSLAGVVSARRLRPTTGAAVTAGRRTATRPRSGRCVNVNRKWRVRAARDREPDGSSDWVYQRGGDVTARSWPVCDFGIERHRIEEKSL